MIGRVVCAFPTPQKSAQDAKSILNVIAKNPAIKKCNVSTSNDGLTVRTRGQGGLAMKNSYENDGKNLP